MADTAAKLFDECPKCGGNGHWTPPPENTGNSMTYYSERACPDCDGLGMLLTATGGHLLDFLRRLKRTRGV